jgi:ankyrin repeat protein
MLLTQHVFHFRHAAVNVSIIESIAKSAVLNSCDEFGNTPLHLAAWNECKHTFEWLVEEKANPVHLAKCEERISQNCLMS